MPLEFDSNSIQTIFRYYSNSIQIQFSLSNFNAIQLPSNFKSNPLKIKFEFNPNCIKFHPPPPPPIQIELKSHATSWKFKPIQVHFKDQSNSIQPHSNSIRMLAKSNSICIQFQFHQNPIQVHPSSIQLLLRFNSNSIQTMQSLSKSFQIHPNPIWIYNCIALNCYRI